MRLKNRGQKGPFRPTAVLDPSQAVDKRVPTPMDYVHFEDGSSGFVEDPDVGARLPSAGNRKWIPLPARGGVIGQPVTRKKS
jgi:hypothetical protein